MKVVYLLPSDMLTEWILGSLESINDNRQFDISVCRYDRIGVPVDHGILDRVSRDKPDCVLYVSQAAGPFVPSISSFKSISRGTPLVHICLDAGDVGFVPMLTKWRDNDCFTYTVACDGCATGPVDFISFHPVDVRPYRTSEGMGERHYVALEERPLALGTCGGFPYGLRKQVMDALTARCGLVMKQREEVYGSYSRYSRFLMSCQIVPDCALSAGGPEGKGPYAKTLKTRAIEVGLAGACLLELRGCALNKWATEDVDYATYATAEEACDVCSDLMRDHDRASRLAHNLSAVVRDKMNPTIFYSAIFKACGLSFHSTHTTPSSL